MLFIVVLIGAAITPTTPTGQITAKQVLVTKSSGDMLPTRDDIPTEFYMKQPEDFTENATGFISGKYLGTYKTTDYGSSAITVGYSVYKFDSEESAKAYAVNLIDGIKEKGGYTKISAGNCFSYKYDYGIYGESGETICLYKNIVFTISAVTTSMISPIDNYLKNTAVFHI